MHFVWLAPSGDERNFYHFHQRRNSITYFQLHFNLIVVNICGLLAPIESECGAPTPRHCLKQAKHFVFASIPLTRRWRTHFSCGKIMIMNFLCACITATKKRGRARGGEGRRGRKGDGTKTKEGQEMSINYCFGYSPHCLHRPCVRERKIFFPRAVLITSHRDHQPNGKIVVTKTRKKGKKEKKVVSEQFRFGFLCSLRVRRCSRSFHSILRKGGESALPVCCVRSANTALKSTC